MILVNKNDNDVKVPQKIVLDYSYDFCKTAVIMGHSELRFKREIAKLMEFSEMKSSF